MSEWVGMCYFDAFLLFVRVSSSEKADGGQWYSQFLLASMPYPG